MLQIKLTASKIMINADIYRVKLFNNLLIINDNYEGIQILDEKLIITRKIKLFSSIVFNYIFTPFNPLIQQLLLVSTDPFYQVLVNLKTEEYIQIHNEYFFAPIYYWDEHYFLLVTYQNKIFQYDFIQQQMEPFKPIQSKKLLLFYELVDTFRVFYPFSVNSKNYQLFFNNYDNDDIEFIDLKKDIVLLFPSFPDSPIKCIIIHGILIVLTEEKLFAWIDESWKVILYPKKGTHFMIMEQITATSLLLVSRINDGMRDTILEIYEFKRVK